MRVRTAHVPSPSLSVREVASALAFPLDLARAEQRAGALLGGREVVLFASARGALSACLATLSDQPEIAVPAYTCAAVPNAVLSAGRRPVFVDVDGRGLVPGADWPGGAFPLVQDTYGFTASAPSGPSPFVRDSAHRAHPLEAGGAAAVVTSFEHSKSLSAGRGGLVATGDAGLAAELRRFRSTVGRKPARSVQGAVTLATLAMGRFDARGAQRTGELFRKAAWHLDVSRLLGQSAEELQAEGVDAALRGEPDGTFARLIVSQLGRAPAVAAHRLRVVSIYDAAAGVRRSPEALVRYPLAVEDPERFEQTLPGRGWDVRGRWFNAPLHPRGTDLAAFGYEPGQAPGAERLAATVVNLPTHPLIRERDAQALIDAALAAGARPLDL